MINWKIRFRSIKFYVALIALIGLIVNDLGLMTSEHYDTYAQAVLYVLIAGGIVTDPTVKGLSDSKQAMKYDKPKDDSKYIR